MLSDALCEVYGYLPHTARIPERSAIMDPAKITFPNRERADRRVNLTMPGWLVDELDAEARHLASTRQSVINTRLADYYEAKRARVSA